MNDTAEKSSVWMKEWIEETNGKKEKIKLGGGQKINR